MGEVDAAGAAGENSRSYIIRFKQVTADFQKPGEGSEVSFSNSRGV
jgi:hypothetical protein